MSQTQSKCVVISSFSSISSQFLDSLEKKDFEQAKSAADRALTLKKNWKLKVSALALRTAPRAFRFFHLGRAFLLGRKPFIRRPPSSPLPTVEVSSEEHPTPLVHQ